MPPGHVAHRNGAYFLRLRLRLPGAWDAKCSAVRATVANWRDVQGRMPRRSPPDPTKRAASYGGRTVSPLHPLDLGPRPVISIGRWAKSPTEQSDQEMVRLRHCWCSEPRFVPVPILVVLCKMPRSVPVLAPYPRLRPRHSMDRRAEEKPYQVYGSRSPLVSPERAVPGVGHSE